MEQSIATEDGSTDLVYVKFLFRFPIFGQSVSYFNKLIYD